MDNWKVWIESIDTKPKLALGLLILLTIPLTILLVFRSQDTISSAATPDQLETEAGVFSSAGVTKQSDSSASGDQYVRFVTSTNPTPTSAPTPTIPPNAVYVPDSIDSTGINDVSSQLNNLIQNAPNGSTIVFKAGGTYRLGRVVLVSSKTGITLEGNDAALKLTSSGDYYGSAIHVQNGSTDTTIRNLNIVGNHSAAGTSSTCCSREHQHGIGVYSATDTLIEQVDISRVGGDCVNIKDFNAPNAKIWSDGVTVRGMTCRLTGRMGVVFHSASRVLIEDNVFDDIGYSVFAFEPNYSYQGSTDIIIRNNTIGSYSLTNLYRGFLLYAWDATWTDGPSTIRNVTLTGNTVAGNRGGKLGNMVGLDVWVSGNAGNKFNFSVTNNTALQPVAGPVIRITDVAGVTVTGNTQPLLSGSFVNSSGSTNVTISNNTN